MSTPTAAAAGAPGRDLPAGELVAWTADRPWLAAAAATALAGWVTGRNLLGSWRHRRLTDGASLVTIAPPPTRQPAPAKAAVRRTARRRRGGWWSWTRRGC